LGIVHEVLDELEVLGLELLTGSLETVDLLELGLLLGQSLADNLAGLGVSLAPRPFLPPPWLLPPLISPLRSARFPLP